ncbi:MAG: GrrA/OscA1 family cyclophane-containing rSAM-modified RiPP [Planktothrix sp.]|uniref:GrrA/OscA1 family cyclophane-containing rSAM-modified RiPP n=1 Tax=Planktothrix sp. TaxID=3088171 RepID=UPI0038D385E8
MNIQTTTGLVGFLLSLSVLNLTVAEAKTSHPLSKDSANTIEQRLSRLSATIKAQEEQQSESIQTRPQDTRIALGWGDGSGRDWVNGRGGGGWADGSGRDWVNGRGGGRWADGGGFLNRY